MELTIESLDTDILILGARGAGLCAAPHAADHSPQLLITVVVREELQGHGQALPRFWR